MNRLKNAEYHFFVKLQRKQYISIYTVKDSTSTVNIMHKIINTTTCLSRTLVLLLKYKEISLTIMYIYDVHATLSSP